MDSSYLVPIQRRPREVRSRSSVRSASLCKRISSVKLSHTWPNNTSFTSEISKLDARMLPPIVTAAAWSINDLNTGDVLWEKSSGEQREMASLTKIMTCYVACNLLRQFNQDPEKFTFTVPKFAAEIHGTHSGLRENEVINIKDLLYGLMLPSGNDSALTIAHGFGLLLIKAKKSRVVNKFPTNPVQEFVREMNKQAIKLGLRSTTFTNPHGLSEKGNKSTAQDLGKLGYHAMGIKLIADIVSTKLYETTVVKIGGEKRALKWKNTNRLLDKGFAGLKTGTTPNAGLCLSCVLKKGENGVIVTLLHAKSEFNRWYESEKLAQWALDTVLYVRSKLESLGEAATSKVTTKIFLDVARNL